MQPSLFQDSDRPAKSVSHQFAEIVFDRPLDHAYTYGVPASLVDQIAVGKRVLAPFGKGDRQTVGFCVGVAPEPPERDVKTIVQVLDEESLLTEHLLKLTRWLADYYLWGWGQVLNVVVPAGVKKQSGTRLVPTLELIPDALLPNPLPHLSPKQKQILEFLKKQPSPIELRQLKHPIKCGSGP